MSLFTKKQEEKPDELIVLNAEERNRLREERDFWDSIVKWADDTTEANRYVIVADILLEERRKRFPL